MPKLTASDLPKSKSSTSEFVHRHIGPREHEIQSMLSELGLKSLEELTEKTIPSSIRWPDELDIQAIGNEHEALQYLRQKVLNENQVFRSLIGMGYYECIVPPVIQRNILENPGWYTAYTPYQAEIAQGRLEALVNFQTLVCDMTKLDIANASLLDEATAAAEAMSLSYQQNGSPQKQVYLVSEQCHPQTIQVVKTRALPLQIQVHVVPTQHMKFTAETFGGLLQYPDTYGSVEDLESLVAEAHKNEALVTVATDLLALTLLKPPGEFGADIAVGCSQRLGLPLGFGGPHAGFFATREKFKRQIPGRIVGVSLDAEKRAAYRLALQTREQHIRREKATSNICTAQVLLAVISSMYAVYHGPEGLKKIALRIHEHAIDLAGALNNFGFHVVHKYFFDTLRVSHSKSVTDRLVHLALKARINLRRISDTDVGISLDELTSDDEIRNLENLFKAASVESAPHGETLSPPLRDGSPFLIPSTFRRNSEFLTHPVFRSYHSEHEILRYISRLQAKDLSLTTSMIPLGSCTMKLNAAAEMFPVTWPEVGRLHPFAPHDQTLGYQKMFKQLEGWLQEITGFAAISLQPNAGSQGEYAGLLAIRQYHLKRGEPHRNVCLIPTSAHGTNPASAVMAGMRVVAIQCDERGNINVADLKQKAQQFSSQLSTLMVTYPSTHGVFENTIREICEIVHTHGGQVYMDGANMNAQMGLCRPADIGADVCHLNLHKTFCIPHGGGGPGIGPIGVKQHLSAFLPGHSLSDATKTPFALGPVSAAPWGSASILPISWMYIAMMGGHGLKLSAQIAILNANYIAHKLRTHYPVVYVGENGFVAHECIVDLRPMQERAGVTVEDVAKRLMDYGFHAPTVSWPVAGTMMIEPTESESKTEIDRFCRAMILIAEEIREIADGQIPRTNNLLKNAPHTSSTLLTPEWDRPYSREKAAFPAPWLKNHKFWPSVSRIDSAHGDRNLFCSCPPWEENS